MSRIRFPLDSAAVAAADERFYAAHPEMVADDGTRIPIDPDRQPGLADEWVRIYQALVDDPASVHEDDEPAEHREDLVESCCQPTSPDDYLHAFVLVPGTTQPVNNLFDFIHENDVPAQGSGRGYWASSLIASVEQLQREADAANGGDARYHSDCDFDFSWSGQNNHDERVIAGRALADRLWNRYASWRGHAVFIHLIGHSHGGNVINNLTGTISGTDDQAHFGDRWFIKSVTYLSTPFFQKIEQPRAARVHGSALIYSVWNLYDLTQLTIADFTVAQATDGVLQDLRTHAEAIQERLTAVLETASEFTTQLRAMPGLRAAREAERLANLNPFGEDEHAAAEAYEAASRALDDTTARLQGEIDGLATAVSALLGALDGLLAEVQTGANAQVVSELREVIATAQARVAQVSVTTQALTAQVRDFDISGALGTLFDALLLIMESLAELAENDRWLRIIVLGAIHILQFFDDTLQTNDHYREVSGRSRQDKQVRGDDAYSGVARYQRLRAELEPVEASIHDRWASARTMRAFARVKWLDFEGSAADVSALLKHLIAQVAGPYLSEYRDTIDNVRLWVGRVARVTEWIPFFDNSNVERLDRAVVTITGTLDELRALDLQLFSSGSPVDVSNPGTLAYLAVVSHSVSRQALYPDVRADLVGTVTPA